MNIKNVLTLIGGILTAIGPVMLLNAPTPTLFWLGQVFTALGGALIAARGLFESTPPPPPTEPLEVVAPPGKPLETVETKPVIEAQASAKPKPTRKP